MGTFSMFALIPLAMVLFQAPNEPQLATIEGKVTHSGTNAAVRKAKVSLTPIGSENGDNVETADDGTFVIKDVKPGRYRLFADKTGYDATGYGARKAGDDQGQVLRVDPGASLTGIDIAMPKQGVIAGKVLDADSEPVARALVMALSNVYYRPGRKTRIPRGAIPVLSDDLGDYRIGQLPPGKYIVCAVPMGLFQPSPQAKESKPAIEDSPITTCYPNLERMTESTEFEIKDGTEIPGVDIRLIKTRTVSVQGQVVGVPPGAGTITILNLNTKETGPIGNATHPRAYVQTADGKFEFKNVPPGIYILHTLPTGLGNAPFVVKSQLEVGDKPLTDLKVQAMVPFSVKGKIKAEESPELKIGSIRVILTPADEITSALAMGTANAEGDLTLANIVPGRYRVNFTGIPSTHYVQEIRAGETVAEGDEVDISDPTTQLLFSFALGHGEVNGIALDDKGNPVVGANVTLIPEPRRPFRIRMTRTDQNGVYKLPNVADGDYSIVAMESVEPGSLEDEEFLKPIRSKLKKVTVDAGKAQKLELTVLPAAKVQ